MKTVTIIIQFAQLGMLIYLINVKFYYAKSELMLPNK